MECRRRGFQCVVMNARGCGDTVLRTPRCFSAAATGDIRFTTQLVRSRLAAATPLFLVGFSLGAGILAKFVAEEGPRLQGVATAAVACCASYDMMKTTSLIESGLNKAMVCRPPVAGAVGENGRPTTCNDDGSGSSLLSASLPAAFAAV